MKTAPTPLAPVRGEWNGRRCPPDRKTLRQRSLPLTRPPLARGLHGNKHQTCQGVAGRWNVADRHPPPATTARSRPSPNRRSHCCSATAKGRCTSLVRRANTRSALRGCRRSYIAPGRVGIVPRRVDIVPIRTGSCRSAGRREGGVDFPQPRRRPHGFIRGCRRSYIPPRAVSISPGAASTSPGVASTSSQSAPVHVGAPAGANAASITPNHVAGRAATFAAAAAPASHPGPCRYRPGPRRYRPGSHRHRPNPHRFM